MKRKEKFYPFSNALVFSLVMKDKEICRRFLEMIFPNRKIKSIEYNDEVTVSTEKIIIPSLNSKSIRLDVAFEDETSLYDIEMQVWVEKNLPERTRYYHACSTIDSFEKGESYKNVKDSYVIFVCLYDPFELGKPIYSFENYDVKNDLKLNDRAYTIILNTKCKEDSVPDNLKDFFTYLSQGKNQNDNDLINTIHKRVERLNDDEGVREAMTLEEEYRIRSEQAREDGLEQGLEQGRAEVIRKMLAFGMDISQIAEITGLSKAKIKELSE